MKQILRNKQDVSLAIKKLEVLQFETKTGKPITFRFECVKNVNRTLSQNSYYWLILKWISEKSGHTKDELHCRFVINFVKEYPEYVNNFVKTTVVFGDETQVKVSTTEFNTNVFSLYIEYIRSFCATCKSLDNMYIYSANEVPDYLRY